MLMGDRIFPAPDAGASRAAGDAADYAAGNLARNRYAMIQISISARNGILYRP
jgi:hypothetical protein